MTTIEAAPTAEAIDSHTTLQRVVDSMQNLLERSNSIALGTDKSIEQIRGYNLERLNQATTELAKIIEALTGDVRSAIVAALEANLHNLHALHKMWDMGHQPIYFPGKEGVTRFVTGTVEPMHMRKGFSVANDERAKIGANFIDRTTLAELYEKLGGLFLVKRTETVSTGWGYYTNRAGQICGFGEQYGTRHQYGPASTDVWAKPASNRDLVNQWVGQNGEIRSTQTWGENHLNRDSGTRLVVNITT